ncbi:MAG: hypothetical protein G01um101433_434 [Parcubacteria group bacterium Gr01-1014_33]|nr:MAG: hypothetical protein G01um101433_434 [Parcubacteria group bacterium Gr01-1014_33]
MDKNSRILLRHILESIEWIERYAKGISKEEFVASMQTQDAVMRRLAIISEATKNLPVEVRQQYAQIPWNNIAGMRDILIHEYFGVDVEMVWNTIEKDLPIFKMHVENILAKLSE